MSAPAGTLPDLLEPTPAPARRGRTAVDRAQARYDEAHDAYLQAAAVVLGLGLDAGEQLRVARLRMWELHGPVRQALVALTAAQRRAQRRR